MGNRIDVRTVADADSDESAKEATRLRRVVVGPGTNQPDPFPGYNGFVGFESPARLKDGTWLVGFLAGYSHYHAPTGARAMVGRSVDQGASWSKPETLIDPPEGGPFRAQRHRSAAGRRPRWRAGIKVAAHLSRCERREAQAM